MERVLEQMLAEIKQIRINTGSKNSFHIILHGNSSRICTSLGPPIQLDVDKTYEMALVSLETYYSFPNIDSSNNNFRYSPNNGDDWYDINIPEGSYELDDIGDYIQRIMKENNHYKSATDEYNITLEPNDNTLRTVLNIAPDYKIDFTPANSIRTVLGFNAEIYSSGYNEAENIVEILSISSLKVTSDIISSSYVNNSTENVIYSFFPSVGPGYKIMETPANLVYLPVNLSTISSIETKLIDQNGKLINMRGENIFIKFHIKEK